MKRVIWTPIGKNSLQETISFISELWDQKIIDKFLNQLDYRIEQIKLNNELAPAFEHSKFRQLLIHKSISLFYINHLEYIKILLIWDNRQNPFKLYDKLANSNR